MWEGFPRNDPPRAKASRSVLHFVQVERLDDGFAALHTGSVLKGGRFFLPDNLRDKRPAEERGAVIHADAGTFLE